jgi:hypothetical protein
LARPLLDSGGEGVLNHPLGEVKIAEGVDQGGGMRPNSSR